MLQVTPRMANAGVAKLKELGYENVEFVDPQLVFMAMLEKAPLSLSRANGFGLRPCKAERLHERIAEINAQAAQDEKGVGDET